MVAANSGEKGFALRSSQRHMRRPLTAPAITDADTVAFAPVDPGTRPRWTRIATWSVLAVAVLAALAMAGMRLMVLPWPMAFALGLTLACALALLAGGVLLIVLALRPR
jgi:hypothetical protein